MLVTNPEAVMVVLEGVLHVQPVRSIDLKVTRTSCVIAVHYTILQNESVTEI